MLRQINAHQNYQMLSVVDPTPTRTVALLERLIPTSIIVQSDQRPIGKSIGIQVSCSARDNSVARDGQLG